jgi:hypothetical protein
VEGSAYWGHSLKNVHLVPGPFLSHCLLIPLELAALLGLQVVATYTQLLACFFVVHYCGILLCSAIEGNEN